MGLDLSKRREGKLGRGRVPKEIKQRIESAEIPPDDEGVARFKAKVRRLKKQNIKPSDAIRQGLNEVGGRWDKPETWKPEQLPRQRRQEWASYLSELDMEQHRMKIAAEVTGDDLYYLIKEIKKEAVEHLVTGPIPTDLRFYLDTGTGMLRCLWLGVVLLNDGIENFIDTKGVNRAARQIANSIEEVRRERRYRPSP